MRARRRSASIGAARAGCAAAIALTAGARAEPSGGAAAGFVPFVPFVSGFEPPCSADVNEPPGYIGGGGSGQPQQCQWHASGSVPATATSPVISALSPASRAQHLRFQHDPGQATGSTDLAADPGSRNWAFSDDISPAPPLGVVTLSFKIRIDGPGGENAAIIQPQTPTGGQLTTVMIFNPNGTISIGDDNGNCADSFFATIPTGTTWTAGTYVPAAICVDTVNDRIRYFYDGSLIYSTGAGEGGVGGPLGCGVFAGQRIEHVLIRYEGNFDDGTTLDIDDVVIQPDHCTGSLCPADISGNGSVDFADILALITAWGPCAGACPADLNGNGQVDFADILALLEAWGPCA